MLVTRMPSSLMLSSAAIVLAESTTTWNEISTPSLPSMALVSPEMKIT